MSYLRRTDEIRKVQCLVALVSGFAWVFFSKCLTVDIRTVHSNSFVLFTVQKISGVSGASKNVKVKFHEKTVETPQNLKVFELPQQDSDMFFAGLSETWTTHGFAATLDVSRSAAFLLLKMFYKNETISNSFLRTDGWWWFFYARIGFNFIHGNQECHQTTVIDLIVLALPRLRRIVASSLKTC